MWIIATSSKLDQLVDGKQPATYFLLGTGLLFLIDGTIGWAGVSKRNRVLLKLFLILTFFIFIFELGILLTLSIFKTNSTDVTDQIWHEMNPKTQYLIQENLICCGLNGPGDYENSRDFDQSCYHKETSLAANIDGPDNLIFRGGSSLSTPTDNKSIMNSDGCRKKILDFSHDNRLYILAASATLLAYQMITMLLTASAISLSRRRGRAPMDSLEELDQSSGSGIHHQHHSHLGHHGHGPTYM